MKSILGIIEELISKLTELDEIMFEKFFPDEYLGSTYKIPFEKLYEQGYRGVIFDIDNTLVLTVHRQMNVQRDCFRD